MNKLFSSKKINLVGGLWALTIIASSICVQGCAYRLTNLHTASPNNIRTIHIEGVYDTSPEPVPHELLWDEIQKAIAANGELKLAPIATADAVLRAHVVNSRTSKAGERKVLTDTRKRKDKDVFAGRSAPPSPGDLHDISIADDFFIKTSWSNYVTVEVFDLRTKKLLLQRNYPMQGDILAVRGDTPAQVHHLRHEESFNASFGNQARSVASRIIDDLLVQ